MLNFFSDKHYFLVASYNNHTKLKKPNMSEMRNLFVKDKGILKRIPIHSIHWMEAKGRKVLIHTDNGLFISSSSMKKVDDVLSGTSMMRIHKSYMINLDKLVNINFDKVHLSNTSVPIGRSYVSQLRKYILEKQI